ncbi:hypothetical protein [Methylopila sp. M107]|nr:hypothetical protein [Methylopila sp. M107]
MRQTVSIRIRLGRALLAMLWAARPFIVLILLPLVAALLLKATG